MICLPEKMVIQRQFCGLHLYWDLYIELLGFMVSIPYEKLGVIWIYDSNMVIQWQLGNFPYKK